MARTLTRRLAVSLVCLLGTAALASAQADPLHFTFSSGQSIQPYFDGWTHNDDGSFEFHFGYLNRNWVEELEVPVGPNNHVTPGDPDQGQPTYFYPREYSRVFSVTVPADFGDNRVVWEVTAYGETYRAEGWLQPEWEIFPGGGAFGRADPEMLAENEAPILTIDTSLTGTVGTPLTIEASVSDDELPPPREFRGGGGQGQPPTFERVDDGPTLPVNVPQLQSRNRHSPSRSRADRVNLTWMQLRGPIGARLETADEEDNPSVVATFEHPGTYLFRVEVSDGAEDVTELVEIRVN